MRLLKMEIPYEKFNKIRGAILKHIPFALINDTYDSETGIAYFNFWDTEYIPKQLKKYIVQPPAKREPVEKLIEAILAEI